MRQLNKANKLVSGLQKAADVGGKVYNAVEKIDNAYHTIASAARAGDAFLDGDIKGGLSNVAFAGLGALGTTSIKRAKAKPAAPRGGAGPVRVGQAGEHAVGISGPRVKIEVNGRKRIPDQVTKTTLTEVKNVKSQSYTRQLRDYSDIAKQNGLTFELWVRPDTKLYGPLKDAISNEDIILKYIPS